ncbi:NB-ARC domain-containing protein [Streptomyces phaeochromogenes]|uniref:NB-ARC domain-containing protein n=1 Tax=Streptomyces phaeochromogenes TaxID=1923 RepID=UPI0037184BE8
MYLSHSGPATAHDHSFAVSGFIGQISAEHLNLVQHSVPTEPATWPHQVGYLPRRAQSFQHRTEVDRLRAAVDEESTAGLSQVLHGMGGVGKTQLAADYAHVAWQDGGLDVLVWVTARSRTDIIARYAQAGAELCGIDPGDPHRAAEQFLAWLTPKAGAKPCRWLIVLDDVTDPDDLTCLWPPDSPHGCTLITTRCRDAALFGPGRRRFSVGPFSPEEADAYLTSSLTAHGRTEPAERLTALAEELGRHPLALSQAVAYVVDAGSSTAVYLALLADRMIRLKDIAPDRLPDDQIIPLAAAWSLSVDRAAALGPPGLVRPMLQLAAVLDPNGIPVCVLTSPPACTFLVAPARNKWPRWLRRRHVRHASSKDAMAALRALHRLHLIDHDRDAPHQPVHIHQLIQRVTCDEAPPERSDVVARAAADALLAAWPESIRDANLAQALRANAQIVMGQAGDALYRPSPHYLLHRLGQSLGDSGQVNAATLYFHDLRDKFAYLFELDHVDAISAWRSYACWRGEAGDPAGAAAVLTELLGHAVHRFGPDHPNTLAIRSSVADWQGKAGDPAAAAAAYPDLIEHTLRELGPDHPNTLAIRSNHAYWVGKAGDPAAAAAAYADLIEHTLRELGPDHPNTLAIRSNHANWLGKAGDPAAAAAAHAGLLEHVVRELGSDHPQTLTVLHGFAHWQGQTGDAAGAAAAYADLLEKAVLVLGHHHRTTFLAQHVLRREKANGSASALVRDDAAQLHVNGPDAHVAISREQVEFWTRIQGPDGPNTLTARNNLGYFQGQAGNPGAAAATFANLVEDLTRKFGPEDSKIITDLSNLAHWRARAGDAPGAAAAYGQLLRVRRQHEGDDDPQTLAAWGSFAHWQGEAGNSAAAAAAFADLLEHMKRVLGRDHSHLDVIRHNLTHWEDVGRGMA